MSENYQLVYHSRRNVRFIGILAYPKRKTIFSLSKAIKSQSLHKAVFALQSKIIKFTTTDDLIENI